MASQAPDVTSTCLICFETRPLKIVGNCKHSFCTECLSTVLDSLESESEVFACPSCKVECPRPWDGVNGMVDFTGNMVDAVDADTEHAVVPEEDEKERQGQETIENAAGDVICDLCDYKQKKVPAVNICSECDNLNICKDCSHAHGMNKATKEHILTSLLSKRRGKAPLCKMHHKLLIRFCLTCKEPVCKICVSLDHGDHDSEQLADTIRANIDVLTGTLRQTEVKLKKMQELQKELTLLKDLTPVVDQQDTLIKEIEDHAQKCIDQIVKWKEDLKKQVKMDYKIVRDIPECLEKVRGVVQRLQSLINGASQLLSKTEHNPVYLDRVKEIQQSLEATATAGDDAEGSEFRNQLMNLNSQNHSFTPAVGQTCCGQISKSCQEFQPEEIFHHKMQVVSKEMFIPCVAVLGPKYYAVAHPVKPDQPAEAIDIYEFPGTLKNTLRDHVPPLYDMSATPDGKIAVLSDGTGDETSSVKLFDPEIGYISSTRDIHFTKPRSLGVTLKSEYVILSKQSVEKPATDNVVDKDGVAEIPVIDDEANGPITTVDKDRDAEKLATACADDDDEDVDDDEDDEDFQLQMTIVDKDGVVKHNHPLTDQGVDDTKCYTRITCGGKFIFVNGYYNVSVYEIHDTGLQRITTCPPKGSAMGNVMDISATMWDNLFLTDVSGAEGEEIDYVYLNRLQDKENKLEWKEFDYYEIAHMNVRGADNEARVSTRDGHIVVMSHGQTIKVFKW
ncbi:uncharacterized protein LOC135494257 isoform X2 [Lineus longissimus]|uniref:uncharacterized protein LOC135494257 isoform X2 n=1 Tax=Lineus longissimus TaxID=88925 RepID=UPI00315CC395